MKKVLFVLFAVLLAVVVSGCSDSAQKPASATDSAAKQESERSGVITVEKYDICPKKDLPLLATWRDNAKVTGKVKAGERAQVIEHKRVVRPKGTVNWQGKTVYVLTPEVGEFFLYFADGTVTCLTFNEKGIKMADEYMPGWKKAYETTAAGGKGDATWIRVKGTKGEGWFCVNDYDYNIFRSEKGTGMFLRRSGQ